MTAGVNLDLWWQSAYAQAPVFGEVIANGVPIRCRSWGDTADPAVLLVHGAAAHSGWWDHIAPMLAHGRHVVAPDLSGHGDSGRRPEYDLQTWADEVAAVAERYSAPGPATVIGHSRGGRIAAVAASRHPALIGRLAMIDAPLSDNKAHYSAAEPLRPLTICPSREDAAARFVTLPAEPGTVPEVHAHIAWHSVREVEDGWTWKFDPQTFLGTGRVAEALDALTCPVVYFRCELGIISDRALGRLRSMFAGNLQVVDLPGAGHHPMLDQPLALVAALRTQLAAWSA